MNEVCTIVSERGGIKSPLYTALTYISIILGRLL